MGGVDDGHGEDNESNSLKQLGGDKMGLRRLINGDNMGG